MQKLQTGKVDAQNASASIKPYLAGNALPTYRQFQLISVPSFETLTKQGGPSDCWDVQKIMIDARVTDTQG